MSQEEARDAGSDKYRDLLVATWRYLNRQPTEAGKPPMTETDVAKAWSDFHRAVLPEAAEMSRKFGVTTPEDAATDFLAALFCGTCPSEITAVGTLKKKAKKYFAEKWNPCGKEIYDVLAEAVRDLVQKGVLQRSDPEKNIGLATRFWIAGSTPTHTAYPEACERVFPSIPLVGIRERGEATERGYSSRDKRLLTPTDAAKIVRALFDRMGPSVRICMQELMSCALNRTRNVIVPFTESYVETDGTEPGDGDEAAPGANGGRHQAAGPVHEEGTLSGFAAKNLTERLSRGLVSDDEAEPGDEEDRSSGGDESEDAMDDERYLRGQLELISRAAANRIWNRVLDDNGDTVFCLYSLPKFSGADVKTKLKDFGPTSTVGGKHLKMQQILAEELMFVIRQPERFRFGPHNATRRIRMKLIGRCAEKGHEVPLS